MKLSGHTYTKYKFSLLYLENNTHIKYELKDSYVRVSVEKRIRKVE